MREQSGRSLIEIIGVLAIGAIMISGTYAIYNSTNQKQKRLIAASNLENIATKTKTLLEYSGYQPVSVDFLIEAGALTNDKAPAGGKDWSVTGSIDGTEFSINLVDLSYDECAYFTTKKLDWVTYIKVNDYDSGDSSYCLKTGANKISFFSK